MFTQTAQLAINASIVLGKESNGQPVTPALIAESLQCSQSYLQKVLSDLTKAGILDAVRGKKDGVLLAKDAQRITLREIIEATQGFILADYCRDVGDLPIRPCAFHRAMAEVHQGVISILDRWTLAHMLQECSPINPEEIPIQCKMMYDRTLFQKKREEENHVNDHTSK